MRMVYATDLHGSKLKFDTVLNYAIANGVKLVHLGSDLLPKYHPLFETQKKFIKGYFKSFYEKAAENGIDLLASFGNDDLYPLKSEFRKFSSLLDETSYEKDGFEFKAYGYVPDYPFGLKTACKLDSPKWRCPEEYFGPPVDVNDDGTIRRIDDIEGYFLPKGTIEGDLSEIQASNRTIMAIHSPPYSLDLDVCRGGRRVGSKAVYDWVEKAQPALLLCGHIHESPEISNVWKAKIGNTVVIQPGQEVERTTLVDIEITKNSIEAQRIILRE